MAVQVKMKGAGFPALFFFPGILLHETAHAAAALAFKSKTVLLHIDPGGGIAQVSHSTTKTNGDTLSAREDAAIALAPLLAIPLLVMIGALFACMTVIVFIIANGGDASVIQEWVGSLIASLIFAYWITQCLASIPSNGDQVSVFEKIKSDGTILNEALLISARGARWLNYYLGPPFKILSLRK